MKFFRQVRQRLLPIAIGTDNKFSKYLLYAIGEILLVVIGIVIALQIDNWNTETKEEQELKGYLSNIANNVNADLDQLNELRTYRTYAREGSRKYMALIEKDPIPAKEILNFFQEYGGHLAIFEMYFRPDKSGFEALKSSGYLGKLQGSEIETALYRYYSLTTLIAHEETSVNKFIEEMEVDLFRDNVIQRLFPLLEKDLSNPGDLTMAQGLLKHPSSIGANFRNSHLNTLFEHYEELDVSGKHLLELILKN